MTCIAELSSLIHTESLFPPVVHVFRSVKEDYNVPNSDLVIPKGTGVSIPIHAIQTDPQYYPDPFKFDPERFSEENKRNRHPMTHLPFGKSLVE